MYRITGTCGNCGGNVVVPQVWHGIYPPEPFCSACGARPKKNLNRIEMEASPIRNLLNRSPFGLFFK